MILNKPEFFFLHTNGFKYYYVTVTIEFNLSHLFMG